jgi:stress-induced morphogen
MINNQTHIHHSRLKIVKIRITDNRFEMMKRIRLQRSIRALMKVNKSIHDLALACGRTAQSIASWGNAFINTKKYERTNPLR